MYSALCIPDDTTNPTIMAYLNGLYGDVESETAVDFTISQLMPNRLKYTSVLEENIIKLELDKRRYSIFSNPAALCDMVEKTLAGKDNEKFFLFIDEVQMAKKAIIKNEYGSDEITIIAVCWIF